MPPPGSSEGAGVLSDGPLNAAVGETVMFTTTLSPTETPFQSVVWNFGSKNIITSSTANVTGPEYADRITFFPSTVSLELRSLTVNDIGEYIVHISPAGEPAKTGRSRLEIYGKQVLKPNNKFSNIHLKKKKIKVCFII